MSRRTFQLVVTALVCGVAHPISIAADDGTLQELEFLVGDWTATGRTFPEKYGSRAAATTGTVQYRRVNRGTWLLSEVSLDSSFEYGVVVMIAADSATGGYRAYAMTNFAPNAVAYQGRWTSDSTLVFEGALDPAGSVRQRVTYEKMHDGSLRFHVEESRDGGRSYLPDSELRLERNSG